MDRKKIEAPSTKIELLFHLQKTPHGGVSILEISGIKCKCLKQLLVKKTFTPESNMITESHVILEEVSRDFRTEIPNIVYELIEAGKINASDYMLYSIYRKIAGQSGACWVGTRRLAQMIGLSHPTIAKSKKVLSMKFALLGGKSLIKITPCDRKSETADVITIIDIWPENHRHFKEKYMCEKRQHTSNLKKFIRVKKDDTGVCKNTTHGCEKIRHRRNNQRRNNQEELSVSEPVAKPDLVPETPIQAKPVCVDSSPEAPHHEVKFLTIRHPDKSFPSIKLTKEYLYEVSIKRKTDWTKQEIEDVWKILENYSSPVRDWFKFVEATILNKRKSNKIKELQACQTPQINQNKNNKKTQALTKQPEITKQEFLEKDMSVRVLANWAETSGCKLRY